MESQKLNTQLQEQLKNYGQILESKQLQNKEIKGLKEEAAHLMEALAKLKEERIQERKEIEYQQ